MSAEAKSSGKFAGLKKLAHKYWPKKTETKPKPQPTDEQKKLEHQARIDALKKFGNDSLEVLKWITIDHPTLLVASALPWADKITREATSLESLERGIVNFGGALAGDTIGKKLAESQTDYLPKSNLNEYTTRFGTSFLGVMTVEVTTMIAAGTNRETLVPAAINLISALGAELVPLSTDRKAHKLAQEDQLNYLPTKLIADKTKATLVLTAAEVASALYLAAAKGEAGYASLSLAHTANRLLATLSNAPESNIFHLEYLTSGIEAIEEETASLKAKWEQENARLTRSKRSTGDSFRKNKIRIITANAAHQRLQLLLETGATSETPLTPEEYIQAIVQAPTAIAQESHAAIASQIGEENQEKIELAPAEVIGDEAMQAVAEVTQLLQKRTTKLLERAKFDTAIVCGFRNAATTIGQPFANLYDSVQNLVGNKTRQNLNAPTEPASAAKSEAPTPTEPASAAKSEAPAPTEPALAAK